MWLKLLQPLRWMQWFHEYWILMNLMMIIIDYSPLPLLTSNCYTFVFMNNPPSTMHWEALFTLYFALRGTFHFSLCTEKHFSLRSTFHWEALFTEKHFSLCTLHWEALFTLHFALRSTFHSALCTERHFALSWEAPCSSKQVEKIRRWTGGVTLSMYDRPGGVTDPTTTAQED